MLYVTMCHLKKTLHHYAIKTKVAGFYEIKMKTVLQIL
jgi:hypothetical protein